VDLWAREDEGPDKGKGEESVSQKKKNKGEKYRSTLAETP
jgi:hypothetical protein